MKLPNPCPFEKTSPKQAFGIEPHRFGCCRVQSALLRNEPPMCRLRETESEGYRFLWTSSFNGSALVHIARRGDLIELRSRVLGRSRLYRKEPVISSTLPPDDWETLQRALTISNFWSLDATDDRIGLDGEHGLIEGQRGDTYHWVERWCPQGAVHDLGRLFILLAGPALADITIY
ncbi:MULTISPECIES: hypothetical protein [unclassified Bradyrhizobium]|uniref:hypothetical protein n=1 Tax=unclassified Bradyrhizobium TaxID=2631580 RepID=UPI002915FF59|nr:MULTISPECIES: hypothetical protein [unclassified Bradyrhizobium]